MTDASSLLSRVASCSSPWTVLPYQYLHPFTWSTNNQKHQAVFKTPQQEETAYSLCSQDCSWKTDPASIFYPPLIHSNLMEKKLAESHSPNFSRNTIDVTYPFILFMKAVVILKSKSGCCQTNRHHPSIILWTWAAK